MDMQVSTPEMTSETVEHTTHHYYQLLGIFFGNVLEFFDFFLFVCLSQYMSQHYFPASSPLVSKLMVCGFMAGGFLMRPLGHEFFYIFREHIGRRQTALLSACILGLCPLAMSSLPDFPTIGFLAPAIWVGSRLLHGFILGSEDGSSVIYMELIRSNLRSGLASSLSVLSAFIGILIALLMCLVSHSFLNDAQMAEFGWRLPSWTALLISALALYLRSQMPAESSGRQRQFSLAWPREQTVQAETRRFHFYILLGLCLAAPVYLYIIYIPEYLEVGLGLSKIQSLGYFGVSLMLVSLCVIPLGLLSNKIGHLKFLYIACTFTTLSGFPLFYCLQSDPEIITVFSCILGITCLVTMIAIPMLALLIQDLSAHEGGTRFASAFNTSRAIFGASVPLIIYPFSQYLVVQNLAGIYMSLSGAIGIVIILSYQTHAEPSPIQNQILG